MVAIQPSAGNPSDVVLSNHCKTSNLLHIAYGLVQPKHATLIFTIHNVSDWISTLLQSFLFATYIQTAVLKTNVRQRRGYTVEVICAWVVECTHAICCEECEVTTNANLKMSLGSPSFHSARPTCHANAGCVANWSVAANWPEMRSMDARRTCWIGWTQISVSQPLWDRGPVNSFFIRREAGPNRFTHQYLSNFLNSYSKLTQVLIINYGIILKSINTLTCTVWHVDKYKITFKLLINSRRISRGPV